AFRVDDLGALLALGFGLLGHGAQHALGHVDLLHFHGGDLHAPGVGVLVEDALQAEVDLVAVREQLVELHFAEHGAQRGLRELRRLVAVVVHRDHGAHGIADLEEDDRVHLQGNVVARDDVLRRDFERLLLQRHAADAVHRLEYEDDARTLRPAEHASEAQDHAALPLVQDLDAAQQVDNDDSDDDRGRRHGQPPVAVSAGILTAAGHWLLAAGRTTKPPSRIEARSKQPVPGASSWPVPRATAAPRPHARAPARLRRWRPARRRSTTRPG